jgi:hypothetical protein
MDLAEGKTKMYPLCFIFYKAVAYPVEFGLRHNMLGPNPQISRMDTLNLGYETMDMVFVA